MFSLLPKVSSELCARLSNHAFLPNKALQLTPSRHRPVFLRHLGFPFTLHSELVRPFGVAELDVSL